MIRIKNIIFGLMIAGCGLLVAFLGFNIVQSTVSLGSFSAGSNTVKVPEGKTVSLDSRWLFVKDELVAPEDAAVRFSSVTGTISPKIFPSGSGSLYLILDIDESCKNPALLINPVYSAFSVYINGNYAGGAGSPAENYSGETASTDTMIIPFQTDSSKIGILIHISNFSHYYGGSLLNWVELGRFDNIVKRERFGKILDSLMFFMMLAFAVMHFINQFYQKKRDYSMFFSLFCFFYSLYVLTTGRMLLTAIIPQIPLGLVFRLEIIFLIFSVPLLANYFRSLFSSEVPRWFVIILQTAAIPFTLVMAAAPLWITVYAARGFIAVQAAAFLFLLIFIIRAVAAHRKFSKMSLLSFSVFFLVMLNDGLILLGLIHSIKLIWAGVFLFILPQTYKVIVDGFTDLREFQTLHMQLAAVTKQKDLFFSKNSDELAKPIHNIVELGESLLRGSIGPLNSEQIATSSLIVSNGIRLSNMVNDLVDFTVIKEKTVKLNFGSVDLFKVSRKVISSCDALVAVRDLSLMSEINRDDPFAYGDERRIEQILYNIITTCIRHLTSGSINISADFTDTHAELRIKTEGCSMAEDAIMQLLNVEISMSKDNESEDMGEMSLAIAYILAEMHSSRVNVEKQEDGSVLFSLKLEKWAGEEPLSDEEYLEMDALINLQPVFDEVTSDRDIEVLLLGKDVEELQIMKSQLASMNYTVIPMFNGRDALSRIKSDPPNLVIVNVKLTDMSGYDVCSEIRTVYSKDALPVILVMNKEDMSEMMEGLTSGANDFLSRPYIQEEFLTRVNTHLQLSRISTVYSRFVPTEFLRSLGSHNIVDVELGDQVQKEMTILFVDIRAFTNLSENMTPEENFKFINSYLSRFSPMITNNGGFVDKYIGDAIMALFPNSPEDAIRAANQMIEHVAVYNGHRANVGYRAINIGVGIHTGNMILGIIGDETRMQGTVISDAVNLASRIQDVTKLYKANVVISQESFMKIDDMMNHNFRFLGRVRVKGKDQAVALFEIFDADTEELRELKNNTKTDFEQAIMKFSLKDFDGALALLQRVMELNPNDSTAQVFIERIEKMQIAEKKNFLTSL